MRAMYLGRQVSGYQYRVAKRKLKTSDYRVKAKVVRSYIGRDMKGFVIELKNTSWSKSFKIDIRKLEVGSPNLAILGASDRIVMKPQKKTNGYIWLVVKGGAHISDIGKVVVEKL